MVLNIVVVNIGRHQIVAKIQVRHSQAVSGFSPPSMDSRMAYMQKTWVFHKLHLLGVGMVMNMRQKSCSRYKFAIFTRIEATYVQYLRKCGSFHMLSGIGLLLSITLNRISSAKD